ncbi:MAG TPA: histidinol-phosphate transaminase [Thiotrichales bacterium]|nr:histidinol-phosphate transaminase [Thiotrichales bacterium]
MAGDLEDRVRRWIRPEVRALSAYHVPDPGDAIKLDAMENPYPWPEPLVDAWLEKLRSVSLNRYPDPAARALKARLLDTMGVPAGMDLLLGNGSDELIQMIVLAVAAPGRVVLAPEPSFVMYHLIAEVVGMRYVGVPLGKDFALDAGAMAEAIRAHEPAVTFLAYPNNPTGNLFDEAAVRAVIEQSPGLVVVDEAYAAFARDSFMEALAEYDNLLVLRTLSKMGLAGLRLGLLAGSPAWLGEIDKTRLPYNINVLSQVSAEFALEHREVLDRQTADIRRDRALLFDALAALPGIEPWPSEANFILFRTPPGQADSIFEGLKARGVLIKNLSSQGGMLTDCLRVTVGTPDENRAFLEALREVARDKIQDTRDK